MRDSASRGEGPQKRTCRWRRQRPHRTPPRKGGEKGGGVRGMIGMRNERRNGVSMMQNYGICHKVIERKLCDCKMGVVKMISSAGCTFAAYLYCI